MSLCKQLAMCKKLFILLLFKEAAALSLYNCGTDNTLEVVSGINNTALCSGLVGQNMEWKTVLNGVNTAVGTCESSRPCDSILPPDFITSRISDAESTLTINTKLTLNGTVTCQTGMAGQPGFSEISCLTDTIIPAEGSCTVEFRRTPWVVFSQCNITRMYSSRGRYSCQWYQIYKTTTETPLGSSVSVTQITSVGEKNFAGSCVLATTQIPRNDGSYSYRVTFIPGRNNIIATFIGTNEILRPILPVITCSNKAIVPENTTITCSCETSNIGKPGGRLKFSKLYGAQTTPVNAGNYDVTRLVMTPQIVNRNDDGHLQFRCDVEWAETITGSAANVSVGYVDQPQLIINSVENLTVMEREVVVFDCHANGKPVPNMRLFNSDNSTQLNTNGQSPLSHSIPVSRCEDTSTYACVASNGMGKDTTTFANLYVNCRPRSISGITSLPVMTVSSTPMHQTFDVIAYPSPDNFSYVLTSSMINQTKDVPSCTNITIKCVSTNRLYVSMCTLTINRITSDASGYYVINVGNKYGHESFNLEVKVSGVRACAETETLTFSHGIGVGIGVTITVAVVLIVVTAVYLWRKKWRLPCAENAEKIPSSYLTPVLSVKPSDRETETDISTETFSTSYDALCKNEVGLSAPYSDLRHYEDVRNVKADRGTDCKDRKREDALHVYGNTAV